MSESYWINPKKGIYYARSAYHDDVDYIYIVDFDKPNVDEQFRNFMLSVKRDGANENMQEVKRQFAALRSLLS